MNPSFRLPDLIATLLLVCSFGTATALGQEVTFPIPIQVDSENREPLVSDSPDSEQDDARFEEALADRAKHEQVIASLENSVSQYAYSAELTEAYLNLAGTLEVLEQYEDAAKVYDQALQTIRISNGLNSLEQIPVLEQLQENYLIQQNWDAVDSNAHLIYHIARRNYALGDSRRFQALDKLGQWKLKAANEELISDFRVYARDTLTLYSSEISLLENTGDYADKGIHLATLHLGEARANLSMAKQVMDRPLSDYRTTAQQTITTQRCRLVRLGDGKVTQICETVEVPNIDYYLDPSIMKNQDINQNLLGIRKSISKAFEELQKDGNVEQRNALLAEMQELTKTYNAFVTDNSL